MKIKRFLKNLYFSLIEKTYHNRLKYVLQKNGSSTLIISFSGFPGNIAPSYNYIRTLSGIKYDKLFILDDFGFRGSYYWFENGKDSPRRLTQGLINQVIIGGGYNRIITIGSSKGGTCAIYYGLQFHASDIYAGACQYFIGTYLSSLAHLPILKAMMGNMPMEIAIELLNEEMPNTLRRYSGSKSRIHLLYSMQEQTYSEHIKYLIEDLKKNNIFFDERIECFEEHNDVGKYFIPFLKESLNDINKINSI